MNSTNNLGETLIPPTLITFAATFGDDLSSTLGLRVPVTTEASTKANVIFITIGNASQYLDAAGRSTAEGCSIEVTSSGIVITGASPLGAWWATRTLLQQAALKNGSLSTGTAKDAPGWGIQGLMVSLYHQSKG